MARGNARQLSPVAAYVAERTGSSLSEQQVARLRAIVDERLRLLTEAQYLAHLQSQAGAAELAELMSAIAVHKTDLFRDQVLYNVELVRQIVEQLRETADHSFHEDALLQQLQQYFSEPEARRQLDTAIDWGRYAELFAYDDDTGELYLEDEEAAVESA